ncbi:MAG TPA: ATP-binding protein [Burkholderiaceae bacterium]
MEELTGIVIAGDVGAVVLTDFTLIAPGMHGLVESLSHQPAWSDIPVIVLTGHRTHSPATTRALASLTNVTILDRPVSTQSMVSAVRAALRARHWQYRIRDQLIAQERAEEALRQADRRKDEFLATLAHELRNPLAPIRTGIELMSKASLDTTKTAQIRQMMSRQVVQLVRLIDDLLDLSRIATGKVVLQRDSLDLRTVVTSAIEACQPAIDHAHHQLTLRLPDHPVWAVGDAARLSQVMSNLVNNAVKYTPEHGKIAVTLSTVAEHVELRVEDNGAGIPPDMLGEVFTMFTQVNQTLDRSQGGLGLGLSLVRRLVELHGGEVEATSLGLGHGSAFTVRLPLPKESLKELSGTKGELPIAPYRFLRVLVVDDNKDAADALHMLIEGHGHTARVTYSGVDALRAAEEFSPDIVLCDLGLPGMDGYEVAKRLRAKPAHEATILVAVTGWGSEGDKRKSRNAGFNHHLVKPINFDEVEAILSQLQLAETEGVHSA